MSIRQLGIREARNDEDIVSAAGIIATAFSSLKVTEWLVPDAGQRTSVLAGVFQIFAAHAVEHGVVHLISHTDASGVAGSESVGAAVWFDHTRPLPPPPDYDRRLASVTGDLVSRFGTLDRLFDEHLPASPHHYLVLLGVIPSTQGAGIGSALLQHHHSILETLQLSAYLEASSTGSAQLYRRHGYRAHGANFTLPNGAVFYPMWRDPLASNAVS